MDVFCHLFHEYWKSHSVLQLIGAGNLWRVLGDSLETDVLADVVATLRDRPAGDQEPLLPWLDGLSKIKRISAVVMLLSASQRSGA